MTKESFMRINAYPFPSAITEKQYFSKTVIVVDVLRATTCAVEALQNGAAQLIPARDAGEAMAFAVHLGRKESVLAGENEAVAFSGFDLGNSPREFKKSIVNQKTIVFCTTNGTVAIHAARTANTLLLGCLRNKSAVADTAIKLENDIVLLCAGTRGECSVDDMVAAGGIFRAMEQVLGEETAEVNDFAALCGFLYDQWKTGIFEISMAQHYHTLKELGFEADIEYCLEEDKTACVPKYENGSIRKM